MGAIIRDWQERRIIRRRAKVAAVITLVVIMTPALIFGRFHPALKAASVFVGVTAMVMIWRQPSSR